MSTTITTANPLPTAPSPDNPAEINLGEAASGAALPASLPDEAYLTRLANEMFAKLPGSGIGSVNPSGLQPADVPGFSPSPSVDTQLVGASGASSNSNLRPSAHGVSPAGAFAPRGVPSVIPLPGEAELRALLSQQIPTAAGTQPRPGVVSAPEGLTPPAQLLSAEAPRAGAPGARSNSNLRPSVHGASPANAAMPLGTPSATSFPGEGEVRSLLPAQPPSPSGSQPLPGSGAMAAGTPAAGAQFPGLNVPGTESLASTAPARGASPSAPGQSGIPLAIPLPGEAELRSLLSQIVTAPASPGQAEGFTPEAPGSHFYFLDESKLSHAAKPESGPSLQTAHPAFDVAAVRRDFPILEERVNGKPLIWLDNAATTQKPQAVIERLMHFYVHENSNIHRGAHELAARATDAYEAARCKTQRFLGASSPDEIIFVRGATEAINLVAQSWGRQNIGKDDEIIITWLEHHANIVPWQQLCAETGAVLKVAPVDDRGEVQLDAYESLLGPRTRLVSFTQVSNALGTVTPAKQMAEIAHRYGARVLIDGAQAVSHMRVNVQELDCDWYAFSGHKVFAPTGIGVLYGKKELLDGMPPWQGGGNMITDVTFERTLYQPAPGRFEAGTGNIADAAGLGEALDYLDRIGMENVARHEHGLMAYATKLLGDVPGLRIVGTAAEKAGLISFVLNGKQSEGVGAALNQEGIAVRAGHHCAQPILRRFGLESTVRPSFALYNTFADIDALAAAVRRIQSSHNPYLG